MLMEKLGHCILKKPEDFMKMSHVSDLMFLFANAGLKSTKNFMYQIERIADQKLALKEEFITINSTRLLWGFSKFLNSKLAP